MKYLFSLIIFSCIIFRTEAITINSMNNGNWFNPATWNLNRLPEATDTVKIEHYIQFDQDFTNVSPGLLYIGECGIICGDGFYTGKFLVYGIVNIRKLRLSYGYSNSYQNYASTTQINIRESIILGFPAEGMSNNTVPVCVGNNCMFDCQDFPVNKSTECIASIKEEKITIQLYPNPIQNQFNIKGIPKTALISIFDLNGANTLTKNCVSDEIIDVSFLQTGLYFIDIQVDDNLYRTKLIVE